jgi:ketosteroid isomerase-like protein
VGPLLGPRGRKRVPIDMELAHIVTVKGGKVLRVEEYSDRAEALKAGGLSE